MIIRTISGYDTSKDYSILWDLAHNQSIVCISNYLDCRDVCQTLFDGKNIHISSRGHCYVFASTIDKFIESCSSYGVEFIIPNKPTNETKTHHDTITTPKN